MNKEKLEHFPNKPPYRFLLQSFCFKQLSRNPSTKKKKNTKKTNFEPFKETNEDLLTSCLTVTLWG